MIRIRRGLDLRLPGAPEQRVREGPPVRTVALCGEDYAGLRPRLAVAPGERVRLGGLLFADRERDDVRFTSPGAGEVVAIHRGERRRLLSVVVRLDGEEAERFSHPRIRENLVASGLWTALRARPFGRIPDPASHARSIFVTAIDTRPLAPDPERALEGREEEFLAGLAQLVALGEGPVRLCRKAGSRIPGAGVRGVMVHDFDGPHPAGLPGTHMHLLEPATVERPQWQVGCEDVAAIGALARTGRLPTTRVVSVAGPGVEAPGLVRTRLGASLGDLLTGRTRAGSWRVVSGSPLCGRVAEGPVAFLGRYDAQVCALEPVARPAPGPVVPIGAYERVFPFRLLPAPLLKALQIGDVERATELGCLELLEEDLALCAHVCPGHGAFGADLRSVLATIERES